VFARTKDIALPNFANFQNAYNTFSSNPFLAIAFIRFRVTCDMPVRYM